MTIIVNGEVRTIADGLTLADFMLAEVGSPKGTAVAVDSQVVPRAEWARFELRQDNRLEILTAVQGG